MGILFGSARIDERGSISGGQAGDQTGREICTEAFYVHPQGWVILRAKSATLANRIAECMRKLCDNNNFGYDQNQRITGYNALAKVGFDPAKVTSKVELDCSEAVRCCLAYAGVNIPDIYTGNEKAVILNTGLFDAVNYTSPDGLYNGDILLTKTVGHTGVIVSGARARVEPKPTQPTSKQINNAGVTYQAHVQTFGWLPTVRDGQIAGTQGASKRLEAIKLSMPAGVTVKLRAHLQGIGWKEYTTPCTIGTVGESRRIEALEILNVSGTDKKLRMKAHAQKLGDSNFGASVGTMGYSLRLESIQFVLS